MISFRLVFPSEFDLLREIYRQSVLKLAPSLYTPEQVIAWAKAPSHRNKFYEFIFSPATYVILQENQVIGFCGLRDDGHIASFYLHPDFTRQGYGTKLLKYVLNQGKAKGIKRFYTEASFFSHAVFTRCGFRVIEMETVKYDEIFFTRYKMELVLSS
ncbi:MAG: GNAT family N-acetyltransferase [Cyanobacterium sp. T60_A2020_053]|nr:GNAT family N-acetyltransferase [Cyanobacterium sp. T60_A2020_053]